MLNFNMKIKKNLFCSAKVRIHLNSPMKSIKQKDSNKFDRTIDEDRHLIIQVCSN
jgi:hypothetical protein